MRVSRSAPITTRYRHRTGSPAWNRVSLAGRLRLHSARFDNTSIRWFDSVAASPAGNGETASLHTNVRNTGLSLWRPPSTQWRTHNDDRGPKSDTVSASLLRTRPHKRPGWLLAVAVPYRS